MKKEKIKDLGVGLGQKILDLIYPPSLECPICGSVIDETRTYQLCDRCIRQFEWNVGKVCSCCGKAMREDSKRDLCRDCTSYGRKFDWGLSCTSYGLMEKRLIQDLKFHGKSYVGGIIGQIMYDRLKMEDLDLDLIIPVPVHKSRLEKRGYNQAEIIARELSKRIGIPLDAGLLMRRRKTIARKILGREERRGTIQDAFYVVEDKKVLLEACKVLLVDDIMTTGSTADACASKLREAGAEKIILMTFASGFDRPHR